MEFLQFNLQGIIQTIVLVGTIFMAFGAMQARLGTLDKKVDKLEVAFVELARQDERLNAMDQRLMLTGRRVDRIEYGRTKETEE